MRLTEWPEQGGQWDDGRSERVLARGARRARAHRRRRRRRTRVDRRRDAGGSQPARPRPSRVGRTRRGRRRDARAQPCGVAADAARRLPGGLAVRADQHASHRGRGRVHPRRLGGDRVRRRRAVRGGRERGGGARRGAARGPPRGGRHSQLQVDGRRPRRAARHHAREPGRRWIHAVHVGHDGPAEGGAARADGDGPRDAGGTVRREPDPLRHRAARRRGPPRDVADVPHVAVVVRLLLAAFRAHDRAHGAMGCRACVAAHRVLSRHRRRDGADPAPPADAIARGSADALRRVVVASGDPRRRAVPPRAQAAVVRLARPRDLRVLRRNRGRGNAREATRLARASRHRRGGRGPGPMSRSSTTTATSCLPEPWARCTSS